MYSDKDEAIVKQNVQKQLDQMEHNRKRIERVKQEVVKQALEDTLQWKQTLPDQKEVSIFTLKGIYFVKIFNSIL